MDTENWLEVDFSRWGGFALDNTKFETLKTAVIQHREIKFIYAGTNGTRRGQDFLLFFFGQDSSV